MEPLNLFYAEPDPDRWLPFDRYPRRVIRRVVRGPRRAGGQQMVFINLVKGLKHLGVPYRVNDFGHVRRNPNDLACIVGKPEVLFEREWRNPVLFGAAVFSHPLDCPDLFERYPVRRMLVPGEWMRRMCEPYYGQRVTAWPVGIDTDEWSPVRGAGTVDVLVYDKVRWEHETYNQSLIEPIRAVLRAHGLTFEEIRYGFYEPEDLKRALARCRAVVFLCEHETQGLAYQQILSSGVPVLAWDRGGCWQDPFYFPDRVRYGPVTSVPYWDERCGVTFADAGDFGDRLAQFWDGVSTGAYRPRDYVLEHLTLRQCAADYVRIARDCR